jgi:hypothetical protein
MGIVHHSKSNSATSEMGQKRTSKRLQSMSALPPKADISGAHWDVRFMPKADIAPSFDHVVRKCEHVGRNRDTECLGCLKIDGEGEARRLQYG